MIEGPSGRPHLLGRLRAAGGKGTVRIEDRFDTGIEDLWSALVSPERLGRWLGSFDGDFRPGGNFRARFFASEWEGTGSIEICDPPRRLLVRMTEAGAADADAHDMEVTLTASGLQTVLVIEERGVPSDQLAAYGAGLQVHVEDLAAFFAGVGRCDALARWSELFPSYRAKSVDAP